jgi:hypothetical protein
MVIVEVLLAMLARKLTKWAWLLRYWALDKHPQLAAALGAGALALCLGSGVALMLREPSPGEPVQALAWFWWVAIALVSAFVIMALIPKPPPPDPQEGQAPETKDGKQLVRVYGTVWVDDPAIAGWVNNAPEPIRKKAGKK